MPDSPRETFYFDESQQIGGTIPKVPLWDTLCFYAVSGECYGNTTNSLATCISGLVSPGARPNLEQNLRSQLVAPAEFDPTYIPHINLHYPDQLRKCAASLVCTAGLLPREERHTQDISIKVPDGVLDDAPLTVMLGAIAWFAACQVSFLFDKNKHDKTWHNEFYSIVTAGLELFPQCSIPVLSEKGLAFCKVLGCQSRVFDGEERERTLKIFVGVAIFLSSKQELPLDWCPKCQFLYEAILVSDDESSSNNDSDFGEFSKSTPAGSR